MKPEMASNKMAAIKMAAIKMAAIRAPLLIAAALWAAAALLRFWIAPLLEQLPTNYSNETQLTEEDRFRDSPTGEWQTSTLTNRRVDQTITTSGGISIIEGSLHIYFASGAVNFETTGLYGVDRRTRRNTTGFGDAERTGQYLFPPHLQRIGYPVWDPMFIGMRQATFERLEQIDGLEVYVFSFIGVSMDESAGYSYLPDVPEHYWAYTDGQGILWVEPLSGLVVDYEDSGVSYFVNPSTGARLADFNQWTQKYTPETRSAQLKLARAARLRILLLDIWLPVVLILAGAVELAVGLIKTSRRNSERTR